MGREVLALSRLRVLRGPHCVGLTPYPCLPAALSCPANSRYELCGPACPASCNPTAAPANCSGRPCVEGCACLPGFVASGGACVAASSCGCIYEGRPLAPGQQVWADERCRRRCTCNGATQEVSCSDTQGCPAGERCRVQNGLLGCYPDRFGSCQASGDPHYVSFDGRRFDFMGTCTYLLAGSCGQNAALPSFRVLVENEHRGSQTVSYTRAVRLEARGVKVAVRREHPGKVLVSTKQPVRGGGGGGAGISPQEWVGLLEGLWSVRKARVPIRRCCLSLTV